MGDEAVAVAGELFDESPFGGGEVHLGAVALDALVCEVDLELAGGDVGFLVAGWGGASQRGAHAGEELVHAERLGDVVVGSRVERVDLVGLFATDGEHDDRNLGPAAQAADDFDAVNVGQSDVEQHDVGLVVGGLAERFGAGGGEGDLVVAGA